MRTLEDEIDELAAENSFSGAVQIVRADEVLVSRGYGLANRAYGIANTAETQLALASGMKALTALAVMSLVEDGTLTFETTAREVLGADLPLIAADVTIEHLLAHRSGIGDYLDESDDHEITDYLMPVPVHEIATTEQYLEVLGGHETVFPAGKQFAYCNGGYVVLALIAERASGLDFHDLVIERVCRPAGMADTAFLRSDELPAGAALGYLDDESPRTNVLHLPVCGGGDGGIYSTVADVSAFWTALFEGRIVSRDSVAEMVRPRSDVPEEERRYGLGFWLHGTSEVVMLEGYDAGVSFRSAHDPASATTWVAISNSSEGVWEFAAAIEDRFTG